MKKLTFIIIQLAFMFVMSQTIEVNNGKVIWQKIYNNNNSIDEVYNAMVKTGHFYDLTKTENQITANINQFLLNRKISDSKGSLYMYTDDITGFVLVEFKEKRYRITVKNLIFISNTEINILGNGVGTRVPIEKYALNSKGEFRNSFLKRDDDIISANLNQLFELNNPNNEW
ncbi:hypothetical protein BUL40_00315 [Croceivirga radicis]|uniref:DUF4468 domain-containing protein n=1 Tax=Croceivirga radicis TaxID=1929488 RepID=A0A1V6LV26_9FLAO|nr:hypothetical protein [Croceivirga radicis]OQD44035.1 hypothetical protein BUL40_00315 [Croceivirga radicis]